ncbi:DMT family transporter [bacterium]|nr:DMT family transporter [bacterium]
MNSITTTGATPAQACICPSVVRQQVRAHVEMIVASLLIATSFPVAASIAGAVDSRLLALLRFAFSTLMFLPIVAYLHPAQLRASWWSLPRYALLSGPLVLFFVCMFEAFRTTTPVKTSAIFTLGPAISAIIAYVLVHERLTTKHTFALACGLAGALWVVFSNNASQLLAFHTTFGDGIYLCGTICFAFYTVLVKYSFNKEPMMVMTFWTLATGTGWLLVLSGGQLLQLNWRELSASLVAAILYLSFFTTLISFFLTQRAVMVIGPTRTAAYTYLYPGLVLLLSWMLGAQPNLWNAIPGVALTLASMIVLQFNTIRGES